ncbi:MAG: hypothetical protein NVSMB57_16410 [Actinomycetota bacterium]
MAARLRLLILVGSLFAMTAPAHGAISVDRVPGYDAFGFIAHSGSSVFYIGRRGLKHSDDLGRIGYFEPTGFPTSLRNNYVPLMGSGLNDSRNVAGGISPRGCLVSFYASKAQEGPWIDMWARSEPPPVGPDAACSQSDQPLPTGEDRAFSPYGPLITLPSGKMLQTFYGVSSNWTWRVRTMSATDSSRWEEESTIYQGKERITEAAGAFVGGATDETARLIVVARSERTYGGRVQGRLIEFTSSNGGATWRRVGVIAHTSSHHNVIPWLTRLRGNRVALVWADRGSLTMKVSIASSSAVFDRPSAWPHPKEIYRSNLLRIPAAQRNLFDFGYPSTTIIGAKDSDVMVAFNDSELSVTNDPTVPSDVSVAAIRLTGGEPLRFIAVR